MRCSLAKLASKLDCSVGRVRKALQKTTKKARVVTEKVKILRAVKRRCPKGDNATKVAKDLRIKDLALRTVRTLRRPAKQAYDEARQAAKEVRISNSSSPSCTPLANLDTSRRFQGW
ncbi:Hypothetical protein, putative [Bodo saltans]|uniref:Uncharacterized protein n=1 Tax=Bodo saltans TaxID=75058 RepID=A0A0S4KIG9_BODSA|nr:Hypothetical protein, putative [Bodo saltans]|eukprot:CUI14939.1 Hypothetical protein, putative [Bodo saltans]